MYEKLKSFLEENKELIIENRWWDLYDKACEEVLAGKLANFLYAGLGQETLLDLFAKEGKIPNWAFSECSGLESITIPDSVTSIDWCAFSNCKNLKSIDFDEPSRVTSIGVSAFYGCSSLTSIIIPKSVTSIGDCAFWKCSSLTDIPIPKSVTSIGYGAFSDCKCHIIFECGKSIVTRDVLNGFNGTYEFK